MLHRRTLLAASMALAAPHALANTSSEDGPLRLVVPYAPGGASDLAARLVAEQLGPRLGQTVVVENKPGASGRLAARHLKHAPAHVAHNALLLANPAIMVVAPLVFKDNGYEPERDFQPVAQVSEYEFGLAVSNSVPARVLAQLLEWLRTHPDQANVGVPAAGSLPHFFALMVGAKAQAKVQVVGYGGSAPLLNDLIGGQVPVAFDTLDTVLQQHQAGKLRLLATSGAQRSVFAKDVPTCQEAGLDLVAAGWNAFFAPAAMPADKAARLGAAIASVMKDTATQRRFMEARLLPSVGDATAMTAMLQRYRAQWVPVVQASGYRP